MKIFLITFALVLIVFSSGCAQGGSLHKLTQILQEELNLSEEQVPLIDEINWRYNEKLKEVKVISGRLKKFRKFRSVMSDKNEEIENILTDEQYRQYGEMKEEFKEKLKERLQSMKNDGVDLQQIKEAARGTSFSFTTGDGRTRKYILYVPENLSEGSSPVPLVIVLHGSYGTGRKMEIGLGFDDYADEYGFIAAYPDAYPSPGSRQTARWNDGRNTLESFHMGIDDVAFILEMIEHINEKRTIDRDRVYVTGASNGGIMAYRLGCEAPGSFAAIAPVIGNIADNENSDETSFYNLCSPIESVSVLAVNGAGDPFIPINGGEVCKDVADTYCEGGYVASMDRSLGKFFVVNACDTTFTSVTFPDKANDGTTVEKREYNCRSEIAITAYIIHGGGHAWPPIQPQLGSRSGRSTQNLDATKTIVEFFMNHSR